MHLSVTTTRTNSKIKRGILAERLQQRITKYKAKRKGFRKMWFEAQISVVALIVMQCCYGSANLYHDQSPTYTSPLSNRYHSVGNINNPIYDSEILNMKSSKRHRRSPSPTSSSATININHFMHAADHDHTNAFKRAWVEACGTENAVLVVPKRSTYRVKQLTFSGPCVSPITIHIYGTIEASNDMSDYESDRQHWILFKGLQDLTISGGGTIDGNGEIWWKNSCKTDPSRPCLHAPTAMTFENCGNLVVGQIMYRNAQQMHLTFDNCVNVRASNLVISSPGDSPNTDGIHVSASKNVVIQRSVIRTGDDCISIVSGSTNVKATDIICGPGHGISIGSLGKEHSKASVSNVLVNRATLSGTTNGVRIKSWQGGSGYAEGITFQNVVMHNVSNPIIIDQNYCDQDTRCPQQNSAVRVNNIKYSNIRGTSNTEVAINFDCSNSFPCIGIVLQDVNLALQEGGKHVKASCNNILLKRLGHVYPHC